MPFDQLVMLPGQEVSIVTEPKAKPHNVFIMIGLIPQQALVITIKPGATAPPINDGQQIIVRLPSENGVAIFSTTVLLVDTEPFTVIYAEG